MDLIKAQTFANALTQLCRDHGVMIWTAHVTTPIMVSDLADDTVHYRVAVPEGGGNSVILQRVLVA